MEAEMGLIQFKISNRPNKTYRLAILIAALETHSDLFYSMCTPVQLSFMFTFT